MATIELTDYVTCEAALRESNLKQSLYDEGSILMDRVLVTLHGEEHRSRRLTEMRIFRRDFFRRYEQSIIPHIFAEAMSGAQAARDDKSASIDLVDLNYRFMVYLAVSFAGIDRPEGTEEEIQTLVSMLRMFGVAATLGQAKDQSNFAETKAEVLASLAEFDRRFFTPSANRRQNIIDEVNANSAKNDGVSVELPMDVLTVLLQDSEKLGIVRDMMLRETAFFFLASAHTSVHSLGHAVHHLLTWIKENPSTQMDLLADPILTQRFVHESFRLHPSSPVAKRQALAEIAFLDGQTAKDGDTVIINLRQANRDTQVFGADAENFNPYRQTQRGISETGITFGIGMHACLGKNLAAGALPVPGKEIDREQHQLGTVAWICHALLEQGIQLDPDNSGQLDQSIERETWQHLPVRFST